MNATAEVVKSQRECFDTDGFTFIRSLVTPEQVHEFRQVVALVAAPDERAGVRGLLHRSPEIAALACSEQIIAPLTVLLGHVPFPVRSILFDKNPAANWRVSWHQDLTVAVRERADVPGFGAWSVKAGVVHAHAPVSVLDRMLTVRLHLDSADETNGALKVLRGSHRRGRLDDAAITRAARESDAIICNANAGDALVMRPLLVHSSEPATTPTHRRVIHIEYAFDELPGGLEWFERLAA